jgi:hypothetical protein
MRDKIKRSYMALSFIGGCRIDHSIFPFFLYTYTYLLMFTTITMRELIKTPLRTFVENKKIK